MLAETSFPRSPRVLEDLRQLTNADFALHDVRTGQIASTTLSATARIDFQSAVESLAASGNVSRHPVRLGGQSYLVSRIEPSRLRGPETLWVLLPEQTLTADRWAAVLPAVIVGVGSLLLLIPVMLHVSRRLGTRIATVQRQVAAVADGNYEPLVDTAGVDDEIHQLLAAVNELTSRLQELQRRIAQTERTRLLGQLAGGLAHQLRNAISGARLATQLHQRRHPDIADDDSLRVALKQLALTEQQLRGLLSLGRQTPRTLTLTSPQQLAEEVHELVAMTAEHRGVGLETTCQSPPPSLTLDQPAVLAAVLNLTLNAVEAVDRGGHVCLLVEHTDTQVTWTVRDNGPGPAADMSALMFEPFVSTKPEGVGLGLSLAQQVAQDHGGQLQWRRIAETTEFLLTIPYHRPEGSPPLNSSEIA